MGDGQVQLVASLYELIYHDIFLPYFVLQMVTTKGEARGRHIPALSLARFPAGKEVVFLESKELLIERALLLDPRRSLQLKYPLGPGIVYLNIFKVIRKKVGPHFILMALIPLRDARELKG